jgi:PAS domain S-box-containing protein
MIRNSIDFLSGGGEMGTLIRAHDWSVTPLGPPWEWPQSLRTAVRVMLSTRHPVYIWWGPELICFYNDGYRQSIGSERHPTSLGKPAREVWEEIWPIVGPQIEHVMSGGGATWHENQLVPITRNGVRQDVYWTYSYGPIDDEDSPRGIGGVLVLCTETTAQVLGVQRLRDSEARLQRALSVGRGIGTWDWDVPTDRVVADERFAKLYRVDIAKAKSGAPVREFFSAVHPDDLGRLQKRIAEALKGGEVFSEEYRLLQADGTVRWVLAEGRCVLSADGRPLRFPGVTFDITERKLTEQRLRELNADLERKVIERTQARGRTWQVTPDLLGALNDRGFFETSNPAWMTVLGWSEEEVARTSVWELLHPDDVERTRGGFNLTQIGQPAIHFPNRYRRKDGGYRWISWVGVPEDGLVYCSGRDITDQKEAEEALTQAQESLRQSQKMEAVGQLTGGLAHDFNNILAGISGCLELLQRRLADGRLGGVERYIDAAQSASRRAATLTQRLLAFSRRQTLDPRPTNVNKLIAGMEELVRRSVGPDIEVGVVGALDLWTTTIDASQLENALLNLSINARDAMMPAGGKLTIETANKRLDERAAKERDVAPGEYVCLSVTDTGCGIPPDTIGRVFDPFFTTKPIGSGTGLGLSMVYGFVRQSGGQIRIHSEVGKGTTMSLFLPRYKGSAEGPEPMQAVAIEDGAGETVLVIDDEPTIRMLVMEVLLDHGYAAIEASDASMALEILRSTPRIDLLITDVGLPGGMNGRQVAEAARVDRPNLKVLFITGFAENASIRHGHLDPGMEVLTKPFEMDALRNKVRRLIES